MLLRDGDARFGVLERAGAVRRLGSMASWLLCRGRGARTLRCLHISVCRSVGMESGLRVNSFNARIK